MIKMTNLAPIGHNNPPSIEEQIQQQLSESYQEEFGMVESLLRKEADLPPEVVDDITCGQYSDFVKRLKSNEKLLDSIRKNEKEVYSTKANAVHNFFKKKTDQISEIQIRVGKKLAKYLAQKEDERRRAAEEKARIEREEAQRKMREAEEKAREAEAARAKAEAERKAAEEAAAAAAKKAAEEAAELKRKAEAEAAEERAKAEAERAKQQAEIDRLKAEAAQKLEQEEIGKRESQRLIREAEEKQKEAERAAKQAERDAKEKIEAAERAAKETLKDAKLIERENAEKAALATKEAKELDREANRALDTAVRADRFANKAERETLAGMAEMSRTRGDSSMASIAERWIGEPESREALRESAMLIWEHIPYDALQAAVQSFVNAGGRELKGAVIYQDLKAVVR